LKQTKEVVALDKLLANGLQMIAEKKGELIKLSFKEFEPLNIICNTLQIP